MYRDDWEKRGYPRHRASAIAAPPPPVGCDRVYHLSGASHAIDNIQKGRLKVATFKDVNDPFELSVFFSKNAAQQQRLDAFINDVRSKYGIICFSEDWLDPALWSHYAVKHGGIALGFDLAVSLLLPVRYEKDRIEFPKRAPVDSDVDTFLGTKFHSWNYEREQRVIVPLNTADRSGSLYFDRFTAEMVLREVILGPVCTENVNTVRAIVDSVHSGVRTYKARLAKKFFSVVPDESTVPP